MKRATRKSIGDKDGRRSIYVVEKGSGDSGGRDPYPWSPYGTSRKFSLPADPGHNYFDVCARLSEAREEYPQCQFRLELYARVEPAEKTAEATRKRIGDLCASRSLYVVEMHDDHWRPDYLSRPRSICLDGRAEMAKSRKSYPLCRLRLALYARVEPPKKGD